MSFKVGSVLKHMVDTPSTGVMPLSKIRRDTLRLYRYCIRSIPYLQTNYKLPYTRMEVRNFFRSRFDEYRGVTDPKQMEMLLWRGEQELEETISMFKTRSHVVRVMDPSINEAAAGQQRVNWLKNFYEKFERD
jgi:NADH dehydrogenase (ubiquinone) 1 alpha subcomplex subunit 6